MNINNLHSLINGRWFIHEQYGQSLLPSIFPLLEGKNIEISTGEKKPEIFISSKKKTSLIAAASYNPSAGKDEYVVVINLKNPIYKYDQECGPSGTKTKMRVMDSYRKDPNCVGVVLDIDSGGGQVSGTPEFHDYLKNYPKPVVSYTDGMMCSAAYYIASATNHIIANKRCDAIGSIGVMVSFIDVTGIYEKMGGKLINEYATKSTEKNRAYEELLDGKPELYIKTELDPLADEFIGDVKATRPGVSEDVFSGGTWNAEDSLSKNLIDQIGVLDDAIAKVFSLNEAKNNNSNNSNKKKSMSTKKEFPGIAKVIGIEGTTMNVVKKTLSGKTGVFVEESQLDALEADVSGSAAALAGANKKAKDAKANADALEGAVNKAIKDAGLDADVEAEATTESKIELLSAKVMEYGIKSGKRTPRSKSEGDEFENPDSIVNKADAHNDYYDKA